MILQTHSLMGQINTPYLIIGSKIIIQAQPYTGYRLNR